MKMLIAESEEFNKDAIALLRSRGEVVTGCFERQDLLKQLSDVEILWVRLSIQIDAEVMDAAPRLKYIVSATTGLNHIDLAEAEKRAIQVLSLQHETDFLKTVRATAEHTVALMLALLRRIPAAVEHVLQGGWDRQLFKGSELHEKTVGLLGYGRLGRLVGDYLQVFGCRVRAHDPYVPPGQLAEHVLWLKRDALLASSDLVSLHVGLEKETANMFGPACFSTMKMGSYFINTSRGELIDEQALLEALQSGRLAGAALDVLKDEHRLGGGVHPLIEYAQAHHNLIITPHIGGCTRESMEKTEYFLAEKLCAAL